MTDHPQQIVAEPVPGGVPGQQWSRLHPLSPLLRGGVVFVAFLGYLISQSWNRLLGRVVPEAGGPEDPGESYLLAHPLLGLAGLVAVILVVVLGAWLSWRVALFRIDDAQVEYRHGMLFRQHRRVPLERIQAVDISRPILARLFGLAQVTVRSAGGVGSNLDLAFLGLDRALQVRDHIQTLASRSDEGPAGGAPVTPAVAGDGDGDGAGVVVGDGAGAGVAVGAAGMAARHPGRLLVEVPNGRLVAAAVASAGTVIAVLGAAALAGVLAMDYPISLGFLVPVTLGALASRVGWLFKHGGFRLADLGGSLRAEQGLTELRTSSVPLHRVQAVEIHQPLFWRPFGWWKIEANVAGSIDLSDGETGSTLLPAGTVAEVHTVLAVLAPDARPDDVERGLFGSGEDGGWTTASPRARRIDPLVWRQAGFTVSGPLLLTRRGRFGRRLVLVPHARIQSMTLSQGPYERRLGLADLVLVSTVGPVSARIEHLDVDVAERLLHDEAARARFARRRA